MKNLNTLLILGGVIAGIYFLSKKAKTPKKKKKGGYDPLNFGYNPNTDKSWNKEIIFQT